MRERRHRSKRARKDRLIQTRVARDLEETLKQQAEKRRLSVSHLIRNVLEDAFDLVDGVMDHVDVLVADSHDLGRQVTRDARDIARKAQVVGRRRRAASAETDELGEAELDEEDEDLDEDGEDFRADAEPARTTKTAANAGDRSRPAQAARPEPRRNLDHVLAWNPVTLNRAARCSSCDAELTRGEPAHLGVSDSPGRPPEWLCQPCLDALADG